MIKKAVLRFVLLFLLSSCQEKNEKLVDKAYKLGKDKKYEEAIEVYNSLIKRNRKNQLAYYNRGICYLDQKNYTKALKDFNKVMDLQTINGVGVTYNADGLFPRVEDKMQVPFFDALYQRAQVKFYMDSTKSSFTDFQTLIDNEYEMKSNCLLWQGTIWIKAGKKDSACKYFYKVKEMGDNEADEMIHAYCGKNNYR